MLSGPSTPQLANDALGEIFELSKDVQVRADPSKLVDILTEC